MQVTKITKYLFLAGVMVSTSAAAVPTLFEDFSTTLSMDKFWAMEETIELDTMLEKVVIGVEARAYGNKSRANDMQLADTSVSMLQADLTLTEANLSNPDTQQVVLGVSGTFYNSDAASPTTEFGEVFVRVAIGDRGNGPEAWYEMQVSTDDNWGSATMTVTSLGAISLNTEYTVSLAYDGDNSFTVQFDNGAAIGFDGPARVGPAFAEYRAISNRIRLGQDNSTATVYDSAQDIGEPASIRGTVDNVVTNGVLLDAFDGASLSQVNWSNDQTTVEVVGDALEMRVTGQGTQETERFWIKQKGLDAFGATVTLLNSSTINNTTRVRGRLTHYLSNDSYDIANGDTPNGWEGFIWTQFIVERSGGNNRAVVYAERAKDADWVTYDELFWIDVGSINLEQPYELLIEKTGALVEYKLDGVVVHSFDLATDYNTILSGNDFEPVGDVESGLQTRVQDDAGIAHVRFDDIVTDHDAPVVSLHAFNAANDEIDYPVSVNVHEDEQVDLIADVSNPAMVSLYIWEQTAGTDIVALPRPAGRVVSNDENLSFTIPMGSNNEDLTFELTVLDEAGVEFTQPFSMRVDNSAAATFAATGGSSDDDDSSDDSSGSAFNPIALLALVGLLGLAWHRRRVRSDA